jgi:hypothetical protein
VALVVAKVSIEVEVTGVRGLYRNVRYSKGSARYTKNGKNAKPERSQPTYSKLPSRGSNQPDIYANEHVRLSHERVNFSKLQYYKL